MLFINSKSFRNIAITLNNVGIKQIHSARFLGVYIDDKLTWNDYLSYISNKLAKVFQYYIGLNGHLIHDLSGYYIMLLYYHTFHTVQ